jgi:hypothetical protein
MYAQSRLRELFKHPGRRSRPVGPNGRALPDFIVIGAQKAGTATLFACLAEHEQVVPSRRREVHFFDGGLDPTADTYGKGLGWYAGHFPLAEDLGKARITGEASPLYLFNPRAAHRIRVTVPDVKLICLLRDPVERAISQYFHEVRLGWEDRPIETALAEEDEIMAPLLREGAYKALDYIHKSYKTRGLYADQLGPYMRLFDRRQIYVGQSESFFRAPAEFLNDLCRFLNIAPNYGSDDVPVKNLGWNKTGVPEGVRSELRAYFAEPNRRLARLLDTDFAW